MAFRNSVFRFSTQQEARRDVRTGDWDGLIASAHAAWYFKPQIRRTFILIADGAYGQRVRVPFQLALGDVSGGVRGYASSTVAGGRRAVLRAEYRQLVSLPWNVVNSAASFGFAAFVDGGRTWAGDVPFGVTSPFVASVGVGVLFSMPRESRQLWRIDVAMPLIAQHRAGVEFRVSSSGSGAVSWTESPDVSRSRERTISPALFTYP
jgi:hemolysin activation/secretion protein